MDYSIFKDANGKDLKIVKENGMVYFNPKFFCRVDVSKIYGLEDAVYSEYKRGYAPKLNQVRAMPDQDFLGNFVINQEDYYSDPIKILGRNSYVSNNLIDAMHKRKEKIKRGQGEKLRENNNNNLIVSSEQIQDIDPSEKGLVRTAFGSGVLEDVLLEADEEEVRLKLLKKAQRKANAKAIVKDKVVPCVVLGILAVGIATVVYFGVGGKSEPEPEPKPDTVLVTTDPTSTFETTVETNKEFPLGYAIVRGKLMGYSLSEDKSYVKMYQITEEYYSEKEFKNLSDENKQKMVSSLISNGIGVQVAQIPVEGSNEIELKETVTKIVTETNEKGEEISKEVSREVPMVYDLNGATKAKALIEKFGLKEKISDTTGIVVWGYNEVDHKNGTYTVSLNATVGENDQYNKKATEIVKSVTIDSTRHDSLTHEQMLEFIINADSTAKNVDIQKDSAGFNWVYHTGLKDSYQSTYRHDNQEYNTDQSKKLEIELRAAGVIDHDVEVKGLVDKVNGTEYIRIKNEDGMDSIIAVVSNKDGKKVCDGEYLNFKEILTVGGVKADEDACDILYNLLTGEHVYATANSDESMYLKTDWEKKGEKYSGQSDILLCKYSNTATPNVVVKTDVLKVESTERTDVEYVNQAKALINKVVGKRSPLTTGAKAVFDLDEVSFEDFRKEPDKDKQPDQNPGQGQGQNQNQDQGQGQDQDQGQGQNQDQDQGQGLQEDEKVSDSTGSDEGQKTGEETDEANAEDYSQKEPVDSSASPIKAPIGRSR